VCENYERRRGREAYYAFHSCEKNNPNLPNRRSSYESKSKKEKFNMRNSTKKITAIAAALLLSVSGVATTAAMAAPAVFAVEVNTTVEPAKVTTTAVGNDTSNKETAYTATVDTTNVYKTSTGTAWTLENITYNNGNAIEPFGDSDVYVKITTDTSTPGSGTEATTYVKATDIVYSDNVDVSTGKATAKIYFDADYNTEVGSTEGSKAVAVSASGYVVVTFDIAKLPLDGAKLKAAANVTWTGGEISLPKSDLALYVKNSDDELVALDSNLYTITQIGTHDVTEKNDTLTFTCTDAPADSLAVTYKLTDEAYKSYQFTTTPSTATQTTTASAAINIKKANWADVEIVAEDQTNVSNPVVTVTLNGNTLAKTTNYTATSIGQADNTIAKVTVQGASAYFDNLSDSIYYVNIGKNIVTKISSVALADSKATFTYTGEAQTPEVTVKLNSGVTLTEGVDYEIVYENNVEVGEATFYVKGIGEYAGKTAEKHFTIGAKKLSDTTVDGAEVTYEKTLPTVADLAKAITVKNGDTTLVYGKDFTASVNGSVKEGENTLRILPVEGGNYTGTTTVTVNVKKVVDLSDATVTAKRVGYNADAKVTVVLDGTTLTEGTDYTVEADTTTPGLATATVTGTGDYTGTATATFIVNPNKGSSLKVSKTTTSSVTLKWAKKKGADGYVIYEGSKKIATVVGKTNTSYTISGLKAGSKHTYKVRAYVSVDGKNYGGAFSDTVTATVKK
jgi:hypothetical protein